VVVERRRAAGCGSCVARALDPGTRVCLWKGLAGWCYRRPRRVAKMFAARYRTAGNFLLGLDLSTHGNIMGLESPPV